MTRLCAVIAASLLLQAAPALAREAPLPWTLRIEVDYTGERRRESYIDRIRSMLLAELSGEECFRSVVTEGDSDLVLRVGIDRLEISEEKRFEAPMGGGPGRHVLTMAEAVVGGTIEVVTPGGETTLLSKTFFRRIRRAPVTPLDDPRGRAVDEAFDEPVRWVEKYLCRKRDRLRKKAEAAGLSSG